MRSLLALTFLLMLSACSPSPSPDLVILGGTIYTVDSEQPMVESVAIKDEIIQAVGSEAQITDLAGSETKVIDLKGRTMIPGFIDSHAHLMGIGFSRLNLDLSNIVSFDELIEMVEAAAEESGPGEWILGRGWHQDKWTQDPENLVQGFPVHKN